MINFKKTLTATLAAATIGLTIAASSTPAAAWGYKHHHRGWGGAGIAAGVVGALALGAVAANAGGYYGGSCYIERRAVTNYYGDVVGFRRVRVCN